MLSSAVKWKAVFHRDHCSFVATITIPDYISAFHSSKTSSILLVPKLSLRAFVVCFPRSFSYAHTGNLKFFNKVARFPKVMSQTQKWCKTIEYYFCLMITIRIFPIFVTHFIQPCHLWSHSKKLRWCFFLLFLLPRS